MKLYELQLINLIFLLKFGPYVKFPVSMNMHEFKKRNCV